MSLDRLSKGPIDFGVGIGFRPEVEFGTFGHDTDARIRAGKLDEGLAVVTGMWTGEPFAYEASTTGWSDPHFFPLRCRTADADLGCGHVAEKTPVSTGCPVGWGVSDEGRGDGLGKMSYEDIAQMTDYVARHRSGNSPFELVVGYNDAEARSVEDLEGSGAS